jgi:DNA polymerase-1
MQDRKTLYLIDGSSFLYRAYYSLKPLHAANGMPVQAVFGFCRMIARLIKQFKPEHMMVVWDSKGTTERKELYPAYKATRQAPPSDLFEQKKLIEHFIDLIELPQLSMTGVEADDLIASLAKQFDEDHTVVIISSDKDLYQLLNGSIKIFDPFKDGFVSREEHEAKLGFSIDKLSFYHALVGDASDNIPGVAGIGDKSATQLCQQFTSLDDLYAHLDAVEKERIKKALIAHKDDAYLSLDLFLLRFRTLPTTFADTAFPPDSWQKAYPFFIEYSFSSLMPKALAQEAAQQAQEVASVFDKGYHFELVTTLEHLQQVISLVEKNGLYALDTETNGINTQQDDLVGISLCVQVGRAYYIPVAHVTGEHQLPKDVVIAHLKPLLESDRVKAIMHNAKFDIEVLDAAGIRIRSLAIDTMIVANLVLPDWQRVGLKNLSEALLGEKMLSFAHVVTEQGLRTFAQVPLEKATAYAAVDAHQTMQLYRALLPLLQAQGMVELYESIEQPTCLTLVAMEEAGIACDIEILHELSKKVSYELSCIDADIHRHVGMMPGSINFNSPRQVEELLFTKLSLPPQKKSAKKTGYSTDAEVLEALQQAHPVVPLLIRYRELFKLKSTYIDALPTYVSPHDGRIHTSYSQVSTATGRLSSLDPNLQNIPVQQEEPSIRSSFKPAAGYAYISADYSQIELRVLAYLSQDEALMRAFEAGRDIHQETAARLFEVPFEAVTHDQRQLGKRINFSILYGLTPYGLSKDLSISLSDAKKYIDRYFAQYPQVAAWMDTVVDQTKKDGYVTTYWGRRRAVPQLHEKNKNLYDQGCRIAINTKAQGTAAELMKLGMISVYKLLQQHYPASRLLLQIHDELLIEAPIDSITQVTRDVKAALENVVNWNVALKVTVRDGQSWHEVTK